MKFGDKLYQLRRKAGLSQEELGNQLNVTRQTISKWELGQSIPSMDKMVEISKLLNVDLNQLVDEGRGLMDNTAKLNTNINRRQNSKWWLVILIIVISIFLLFSLGNFIKELKRETGISVIFNFLNEFIEKTDKLGVDSDFEKTSFNNSFEHNTGTRYGSSVAILLDTVITNNKTNKDYIIRVVWGDFDSSSPEEIKNIKHNLDDFTKYEISLDYNNNGYVNRVTIEDIIKEEEPITEFDIKHFNNKFEMYAGKNTGTAVCWLLDNIITNNKTNDKHIISVVYKNTNTTDEQKIRNLKKKLDNVWADYEVIFDYDEGGFISKVTITDY